MPIKLTQEQFRQRFGDAGLNKFRVQTPQPQQSRFQETAQDIKQTGQNIFSRFTDARKSLQETSQRQLTGETNIGSGFLQSTGAIGGAITESIGDIFTGIIKGTLSQEQEQVVKTKVAETAKTVLENPAVDFVVKEHIKAYQESSPETQRNLEGIFNLAMLGLDVSGVGAGAKTVKKTLQVGSKVLKGVGEGIQATGNIIKGGVGATLQGVVTATDYTKGRLPKLLGIFSGESDDVIRNALANPALARQAIDKGDDVLRNAVREGAENSIKIKSTFIQAYSQAKQNILGESSKIVIPKNNMLGKFNKMLKDNDVIIGKNGKLDFTKSRIKANPGEVTKIKSAYQALRQWESFTINGLDRYKLLVGDLRKFATEAGVPSKSPFLGKLYHEINETIFSRLPDNTAKEFKSLNLKFGNNIELYDDVIAAFNSGDPFTKLANSLGKNKDTLRQILEFYQQKTGKEILPIIAGRELALEKTAAFGFLNPRSWVDFFISPEVQGKIITEIGEKLPK